MVLVSCSWTRENIFVDHCHFNDTGNNLIAQDMAPELWERANIH